MGILIVEDSPIIAQMFTAILEQGGLCDVHAVLSGEEALEFLSKKEKGVGGSENIELILLDLVLPGIDGLEFCRTIKGMEGFATVPILVVTARNDEKTLEAAFEAGAWDFMVKPVKGTELLVRVKAALVKMREIEERFKGAGAQ